MITTVFGLKSKKQNDPAGPGSQNNSAKLEQGLSKTRKGLFGKLIDRFVKDRKLDAQTLEEFEDQLLIADIGIQTTQRIIDSLKQRANRGPDNTTLFADLNTTLLQQLQPAQQSWTFPDEPSKPYVILMVGVNGVGKTTTIGKLSRHLLNQGKTVQFAAGDTFRAAAVEQLQEWGKRNGVAVTAQQPGADSGAVIFDSLLSARANNIDIVLADTAGRLHTNNNLMEELKKIRRVINKFDENTHCEVMLTLDAGTGQNALVQAREFNNTVGIDSIILTKLDGTAKGGIIFPLVNELKKPVRFIGVGEQIDDLRPFVASDFVNALLVQES